MGEENYEVFEAKEEVVWYPKWYHRIAINTLSSVALPKHIGFIMDGNRRWARERGLEPIEGHLEGAKKFDLCLDWMQNFGIPEMTAYAFSSDNFKRNKNEVKQLMRLFTTFFQRTIDKIDRINERGRRFMVYGNIDLLPSKIRTLAAKVMLQTMNNKSLKVNIALCYKTSEEMENATEILQKAVEDGDLLPEDIDETLIDKILYSGDGECPDYLIRTSGEQRYSDFYMWQLTNKPLFFCGGNWPDLSFTTFLRAIFAYQRYFPNTSKIQKVYDENLKSTREKMCDDVKLAKDDRVKKFLAKRKKQFIDYLTNIVNDAE